jgi:hypothetical protein
MLRCPYCHDDLAVADGLTCGRCQTRHHSACFVENGGCSVMGCHHAGVPRPRLRATAPAATRSGTAARAWSLVRLAGSIVPSVTSVIALSAVAVHRTQLATPAAHAPILLEPRGVSFDEKRANEIFAFDLLARICRGQDPRSEAVSGTLHGYCFAWVSQPSPEAFGMSADPVIPTVTGDLSFTLWLTTDGLKIECRKASSSPASGR